jgi:hypothetical protein
MFCQIDSECLGRECPDADIYTLGLYHSRMRGGRWVREVVLALFVLQNLYRFLAGQPNKPLYILARMLQRIL